MADKTKTCCRCGISRHVSFFAKKKTRKDGLASACKVCVNKKGFMGENITTRIVQPEYKYQSVVRQCKQCFILFMYTPGGKDSRTGRGGDYCSKHCYGLSRRKEKIAKFCKCEPTHCQWCGELFMTKPGCKMYCSSRCSTEKQIAVSLGKRRQLKEIITITCLECGEAFRTVFGIKNSVFCSRECQDRHHNRISGKKRRARKMGAMCENVDPFIVFDRDGYVCQLCGKKTNKKKRGTYHDKAPELDHIIPLSLGGEHSYRNTQCSCRACNGSKGASALGQLRLF